ncbi:hypothetical protein [Hylemonella gracilis]|nr:hypothetical protein [Hylemonella gracilis]
MTQRLLEAQNDGSGADGPVSPWSRALLGVALAALLLVTHALPHLI